VSRKEHAGIRALTCDLGDKDPVLPQPFPIVLGKLFNSPAAQTPWHKTYTHHINRIHLFHKIL